MTAVLVLEDGKVYHGAGFGAQGTVFGEVVFNTGMTGYQEVLTDPSYTGQIVTMTYPLIGNYGVNDQDEESAGAKVRGFVVREACAQPNNWRNQGSLSNYLAKHNILGISGIDTRSVTRRIRSKGTLKGAISTDKKYVSQPQMLLPKVTTQVVSGPQLVQSVTTTQAYHLPGNGPRVVVVDFGIKQNILRMLQNSHWDITVVPSDTSAAEIISYGAQGLFLSNGPGDPQDVPKAVDAVRSLAGNIPIAGICLGHQIIGLAMGCESYKLKFGHRGANHPVKDLARDKTFITAQNHGYAIAAESLPDNVEMTHQNINDGTVEGLRVKDKPIFSVQYHPEAAPGPEDSRYLFEHFTALMKQ